MKKKLVAIISVVAMLVTMFPATVFAENEESTQINTEEALNKAILEATENSTIDVSADIETENVVKVAAGKKITIDLNGHTLSAKHNGDVIENRGDLTIKNGTVSAKDDDKDTQGFAVSNLRNATLRISQDEGVTTKLIGRSAIKTYGTTIINAGKIESYNRNAIWGQPGSMTYIYDGDIKSNTGSSGYGRAISSEGNVYIYGGSFYSGGSSGAGDNYMNAIGIFNRAELIIDPQGDKSVTVVSKTDYAVSTMGNAKITIKGGDFECQNGRVDIYDFEEGDNITIAGGSFKHEPLDSYLEYGYVSVYESEKYVVKKAENTTDVTVNSYAEFINAVNGDATHPVNIILGSNVTIPEGDDLTLKKGFTVTISSGNMLNVNGILRLSGELINSGTLSVSETGFIQNPLNVNGDGVIIDYPTVINGECKIGTPMQLQWLSRMVEINNNEIPKRVVLENDINLPDVEFTPIGKESFYYNSTFDGNGHAINNLNVTLTYEYRGGLFAQIGDIEVKDLVINDASIKSIAGYIGAVAGYASGTCIFDNVTVNNCEINSPVSYGVGGFIGQVYSSDRNDRTDFINCIITNSKVEGYANVGAFWGTSTGSLAQIGIYNCELGGSVKAINVNGGVCGGYGDSAKVQIIGLDNEKLNVTVKNEDKSGTLVSASSEGNVDSEHASADKIATKDESGNWKAVSTGTKMEAIIGSIPYETFETALANAEAGDTVTVLENVEIDKKLVITKDITLNLNDKRITASSSFGPVSGNDSHLIEIVKDGVTIENGSVKTTDSNKHGIHIYNADNVTLKDVTIDHTDTNGGASIVVNGSTVSFEGNIDITIGEKSWYGINVDSRNVDEAVLTINGMVSVNGDDSKEAIVVESTKEGDTHSASLNIAENASVSGDITVRHHESGNGDVSANNSGTIKGNLTVSAGTATNAGTISGSVSVSGTGTTFTNTGNTGTIISDENATVIDSGNKPSTPSTDGGTVTPSVTKSRVAGDDRFETAIKVADKLKSELGVVKFNNIVVANSDEFADALSATALAADKDAPILVVNKNNESTVKTYITNNLVKGGNVYIIGGTAVVSESFEKSLTNCKVTRLGGSDRYETNLEVLKTLGVTGASDIMVASGLKYPDALSASATGNPVLLVGKTLTDNQKAYLATLGGNDDYYVIGGTAAVNATVMNQLNASKLGTVTRLGGDTRYETGLAVAEEFFTNARTVVIASGNDFPDGLTGGVLANAMNAPLMLVNQYNTDVAADYVDDNSVRTVVAIGGTTVIPDATLNKVA